ncbi:MAG: DUF4230 domain-containing protein [Muribaculaceae bacterium]|nr:DUF4230 domain-containing protein [Muribaculaceae bacterium]
MTKFKSFSFLLIGIFLFACSKAPAPDHTQLYEEIRQVNKMEFASIAVTKTVKTERSDWYKVGKRIAVYSYDTHLKAYIDLNLIAPEDMEFDEENKTVRLTLPPVQIEVAGRDMQMRKEYENVGMFRSNVSSQERAKMKEKANTELMKELQGNPEYKSRLENTARQKARFYFETLFKNSGYTASIQFSDERKPSGDFNLNNYE